MIRSKDLKALQHYIKIVGGGVRPTACLEHDECVGRGAVRERR
jgi:hypothetical protein